MVRQNLLGIKRRIPGKDSYRKPWNWRAGASLYEGLPSVLAAGASLLAAGFTAKRPFGLVRTQCNTKLPEVECNKLRAGLEGGHMNQGKKLHRKGCICGILAKGLSKAFDLRSTSSEKKRLASPIRRPAGARAAAVALGALALSLGDSVQFNGNVALDKTIEPHRAA